MSDVKKIWDRATAYLRGVIEASMYKRSIEGIVPVRLDGSTLVLGVSNAMFCFWVERNFKDVIEEALNSTSETPYGVAFEEGYNANEPVQEAVPETAQLNKTDSNATPARRKTASKKADKEAKATLTPPKRSNGAEVLQTRPSQAKLDASANAEAESKLDEDSSFKTLDRRFTFSSFVVGDNSRFAVAVCQAVAKTPGTSYNPLFLYSGTGLGKTHLMQAIAQEILTRNPKANVMYVTSEDFCNQYVEAMKDNRAPEFRRRIRNLDALLIDDVQFIGNKERFQEAFLKYGTDAVDVP